MRRRKGTLAALFGAVVLLAAAMRGRLRRYAIVEQSMEPTLSEGDWTVARHLSALPRRGAIVVFPDPRRSETELVKRVVGLPGERVTIANGQVHIAEAVLAEPWADGPTRPDGEWILGPDELFVLGDARSTSAADSRTLGPIAASTAQWQITARYWPPGSIGRI